ncbi:MAG: carboxyl transferase domain-containing protein [Chloroflexota bacterium]
MVFDDQTILENQEEDATCFKCDENLENSSSYLEHKICSKCNFHFHISARDRIKSLVDRGTFNEIFNKITTSVNLDSTHLSAYSEQIKSDRRRTGLNEAVLTGNCKIGGSDCVLLALDFGFLGGSMGLIVGEKVALSIELAAKKKIPVVAIINSGGSRVQEGVMSLMQMSKTVVATNHLKASNQPMISVLGNPSTGQVMASFVALSDIIIAEPEAHIGYSPYRKLKELTGSVQSTNYLSEDFLEHGFIDKVTSREKIRFEISTLLNILKPSFTLSNKVLKKNNATSKIVDPTPWEAVQLSRKITRPKALDYIERIITDFTELHGDRSGADDNSIRIGLGRISGEPVMIIAQQREIISKVTSNNVKRNFDKKIRPEGFRKASRAIRIAERFRIPCINFIDSVNPELSLKSEYDGLAFSIADLIAKKLKAETPMISIIIGEGGSETALAFTIADSILMLQNSIFTPLSPEEAAKIQLGDRRKAKEISNTMKLTSRDCKNLGIIDRIIKEPEGGAHKSHDEASKLVQETILEELIKIRDVYPKTLVRRRSKKFRQMGEYSQQYKVDLSSEIKIWQSALKAGVKTLRKKSTKN